jgi:hypothetical protein
MKTAAQKYSESNAEAILAYFRGVDGTFVPTPAHPSPRYPMVDDTVGIHTVRLSQSTLAGYLEQAFVAGEREEFGRITGKKSPFKREGLHSHEEPMPGLHSPWHRDCPQCVADKLISEGNVPGVEDSCVEDTRSSLGELILHDESRTDEKLRLMIAEAEAEADRNDGREPGDTRDEESLEDHNIQGLGAYRDVFDAGGEQ